MPGVATVVDLFLDVATVVALLLGVAVIVTVVVVVVDLLSDFVLLLSAGVVFLSSAGVVFMMSTTTAAVFFKIFSLNGLEVEVVVEEMVVEEGAEVDGRGDEAEGGGVVDGRSLVNDLYSNWLDSFDMT